MNKITDKNKGLKRKKKSVESKETIKKGGKRKKERSQKERKTNRKQGKKKKNLTHNRSILDSLTTEFNPCRM